MADFVDQLSDAELRTKLVEYGFPVVPITATTRKLMVKKLKNIIESKKKSNNDGRKSLALARYSSEEESDADVKETKKNRRATVGGAMLPPTTAKIRKTTKKVETKYTEEPEYVSASPPRKTRAEESKITTTSRRTTQTFRTEQSGYEDGSDSDVEILEDKSSAKKSTAYNSSYSHDDPFLSTAASTSSLGLTSPSGLRPSLRSTLTSDFFTSNTKTSTPQPVSSSLFSSDSNKNSHSTSGSSSLEKLNQIRSRLSLNNPSYPRSTINYDRKTIFGTSSSTANAESKIDTPYFSDFTNRLSQITGSRRSDGDQETNIKESDSNGGVYTRPYIGRYTQTRSRNISSDFKSSQEKNIFKNNVVSFTLVGIVILFFLAIFFVYMGMKTDQLATLDANDIEIPYCDVRGKKLSIPGINCVLEDKAPGAMNLLKILLPELTRRAVNFKCNDNKVPAFMTEESTIKYLKQNRGIQEENQILADLHNLQVIVMKNPRWGLSLIKPSNIYEQSDEETALDSIEQNDRKSNLALVMLNPDVPLKCLIFGKLYMVLTSLFAVSLGFAFLYFGQQGIKLYMRQKKNKNDQIFNMVERIIDILSTNCSGDGSENFLAVNHVRDMLIAPQDRQRMSTIWEGAVNFLNNNESRVRAEVQIVSGEEFKVWRWLGNSTLNLSGSSNRGKVWQGQAFETQEGSVNSLPCSPTQCLKIRQMFDKNETSANWKTTIQDAILEKCGDSCKILHIGIDTGTCCVYVKCTSQKDAGIAYKNLHGWWYDGKLITVKYLRLERYLERFPDSPSSGPFLRPSNNKKLSLQNDWTNNEEN